MTFLRAPSCQVAQLEFNTRLVTFILGKESRVPNPGYIHWSLPPVPRQFELPLAQGSLLLSKMSRNSPPAPSSQSTGNVDSQSPEGTVFLCALKWALKLDLLCPSHLEPWT